MFDHIVRLLTLTSALSVSLLVMSGCTDFAAAAERGFEWSQAHPFDKHLGPASEQVGDLIVDVPPDQHFFMEKLGKYATFDYSIVSDYKVDHKLFSLAFISQDAWKLSGAHVNAAGWESTFLLVSLTAYDRGNIYDTWCSLQRHDPESLDYLNDYKTGDGFRIFGESRIFTTGKIPYRYGVRLPIGPVTVLNSPLIFSTMVDEQNQYVLYLSELAITHDVLLELRFTSSDLIGIGVAKLLHNIDQSLRSMLARTPDLDRILYHRMDHPCPPP